MLFYALSGLINGIIATVFGIFTLLKNPRGIINRTYAVLSLWIAVWGYAYCFFPISQNNKNHVLLSFQILQIGAIFIGPAFLHFILSLLNLHKQKKSLIYFYYFLGVIFVILDFTPFFIKDMVPKLNFNYWASPGIAYHFYLLFWSVCILYPWYLIIKKFKGFPEFKQNQIKYVFIASVIGFIGGATNYPLWYNIPIPPFGTFLVGVHVLILAYAIAKYRLMDISITITRAGIFLAVYTIVLGVPFVLSTSGKQWLISLLGAFWWIGPLVLMASLGTSGPFVYIYLKNSAEAILLREQRRYQATLKLAAVDLTRIRNLQKLLDFIANVITESVKISHSLIYFFDAKEDRFVLKAEVNSKKDQPPTIDKKSTLIFWLKKQKDALVYEEIKYMAEHNVDSVFKELETQMRNLSATVVIPCFLENTLLDIIILGEKLSGRIYSQEDLDNFSVLASEAALATENALLYEKIENEVKERTSELVQTQKQLVQAEKLATVGTLAGGVAHEINNPLTAILTNVQMLLATKEPDRESLEMIEEATKRCKTIVQKLMTYAKKPMESTMVYKINFLDIINNVVNFLTFQLEQENIKILFKAQQDNYPVKGNHNELEQVITNMLLNAKDAIKQIKKSGIIEITLSQNENSVKVEIKDEGVGIPKEIISRIFDPFFTTKEVGKGLGLGLSVCQAIVDKHNGKITVQSEVNKGSTFIVSLPRLKEKSVVKSEV
jgi:signal transduction histidine kinase